MSSAVYCDFWAHLGPQQESLAGRVQKHQARLIEVSGSVLKSLDEDLLSSCYNGPLFVRDTNPLLVWVAPMRYKSAGEIQSLEGYFCYLQLGTSTWLEFITLYSDWCHTQGKPLNPTPGLPDLGTSNIAIPKKQPWDA